MSEDNSNAIKEALKRLDPAVEAHWTSNGSPRLDALGIPGIDRASIMAAAPHFTRTNRLIGVPGEEKKPEDAKEKKSLLEAAQEEQVAAAALVNELEVAAHELGRQLRKAHGDLDMAIRKVSALSPAKPVQSDIMDYLHSVESELKRKIEFAKAVQQDQAKMQARISQ
jgi:hypothetical protein